MWIWIWLCLRSWQLTEKYQSAQITAKMDWLAVSQWGKISFFLTCCCQFVGNFKCWVGQRCMGKVYHFARGSGSLCHGPRTFWVVVVVVVVATVVVGWDFGWFSSHVGTATDWLDQVAQGRRTDIVAKEWEREKRTQRTEACFLDILGTS